MNTFITMYIYVCVCMFKYMLMVVCRFGISKRVLCGSGWTGRIYIFLFEYERKTRDDKRKGRSRVDESGRLVMMRGKCAIER